ncbi:hypothetical protein E2C01_101095 [Portunus trituberculatus]|uniref:Uncharacterized protein n=1 Tax=Portunus trituberculatus TaxID=210409 RepID=A0A5B7KER3_PORTR|nr:hypothetical protein [Portunus trituberculatus]
MKPLVDNTGATDTKARLRRNSTSPVASRSRSRSRASLTPQSKHHSVTSSSSSLVQLTTKTPCNVA